MAAEGDEDEDEVKEGFLSEKAAMIISIVNMVGTVLFMLLLCQLLLFHVYLIEVNLTTYGYIRRKQGRRKSKVIREINKSNKGEEISSMASSEQSRKTKEQERRVSWAQILCGSKLSGQKRLKTNQVI